MARRTTEPLEITDEQIIIKGENRSVSFKEILARTPNPIVGRGSGKPPQNVALLTLAAHFTEVAVDTRTGNVEVVRLIAAHDVGRVIKVAVEGAQPLTNNGYKVKAAKGILEQALSSLI